MAKTKKVKTKQEVPKIAATLKVLGRYYNSEGESVAEAIGNLKPEMARGVGILTLKRGDILKERVINMSLVNNLFGKYVGNVQREIAKKNILILFSGIF